MEKKIRLSKHAELQANERGASFEEIVEAINHGVREPAKNNRLQSKENFQFNNFWNDTLYTIKQVAPVFVEENDEIIVITVYTYYF